MTNLIIHSFIFTFTSTVPITPTNTENYLPSDDPNVTNLMVSHYDCEKQHNPRQFNLFNVKHCTEAPPDKQHCDTMIHDLKSFLQNVLELFLFDKFTHDILKLP